MSPCSETTGREYVVFNLDRRLTIAERVRVAGNSAARRKGLLGFDSFPAGMGLWIAPCEAIHTFGMKMPIDAIFIDRKFQVRKVRTYLAPSRVSICVWADSVLEVEAGTVARTRTVPGDRLKFEQIAGPGPSGCFGR